MAGRQELKLLGYLSSATCTKQFREMQSRIVKLRLKVASDLQQHKLEHLTDGLFITQLLSAVSSGLKAICLNLSEKEMLEPSASDSIASLLATANNLMRGSVWLSTLDPAAASDAQGTLPAAEVVLAQIQASVSLSGILVSMAQASTALALVISKIPAPHKPKHSKPPIADADIQATSSIAIAVLDMWSVMGAVWGAAERSDAARVADHITRNIWVTPVLQATIRPTFCLILALLDLECSYSSRSTTDTASSRDTDSSSLFSPSQAYIWESVFVASSGICNAAMDLNADGQWCATGDAGVSAFRQIIWSPEVQDLQLFVLAAVASAFQRQRAHQQQQKVSSVMLQSPSATTSSNLTVNGNSGQGPNRQQQSQPPATDCSAQVLKHLKLTEELAQQFVQAALKSATFEMTVLPATAIMTLGSSTDRLFHSTAAATLPVLKMKLLMKLIVLLPVRSLKKTSLAFLREIVEQWYRNFLYQGAASLEIKSAVAAAVADSSLAPLLLEVGPVVLKMQDDDVVQNWAAAVQASWAFVLWTAPSIDSDDCSDTAQSKLTDIIQQQPFVAAAAVEATLRSVTAQLQTMNACVYSQERHAIESMLDMVYMTVEAVADNSGIQAAAASDISAYLSSNSSSLDSKSSWPSFSAKSPTAKPSSLFNSCLKFLNRLVAFLHRDEKIKAAKAAMLTFNAVTKVAAAAAAASPMAQSDSTAVAVPWVHTAARALHCCATVLLFRDAKAETDYLYPFSHDDTIFLFHFWPRLADGVSWCCDQLALLTGHNTGCSATVTAARGSSSSPADNACCMPQELAQQVLQLLQELPQILMGTQQTWIAFGGSPYGDARHTAKCQDVFRLAKQLQETSAALASALPTLLCCNNPSCSTVSGVSELSCVGRRKCSRCQSAGYCSKECQKQHWSQHKKICK